MVTFDERLLGVWADDTNDVKVETRWEFKRLDDAAEEWLPEDLRDERQKLYRLNAMDGDGELQGSLVACLLKLGDQLFLDIFPDRFPSGQSDAEETKLPFNAGLFVPVHTFARIDSIGDELKGRISGDSAKEMLKAEPRPVRAEWLNDTPLLTASTKELQAFILKHAKDERLFSEEVTLYRRK